MSRDIFVIWVCATLLAAGQAEAKIYDQLDEFTDERSLVVIFRGTVTRGPEGEMLPFFRLRCDFNMKRIHALVIAPSGSPSSESYYRYHDLRQNDPINVDLRFDRKPMLEERWNWGQPQPGANIVINWMAVHLLHEALAADRLIVRVGGEGNQTLSFDLAVNRADLLEFRRRCAWVK